MAKPFSPQDPFRWVLLLQEGPETYAHTLLNSLPGSHYPHGANETQNLALFGYRVSPVFQGG